MTLAGFITAIGSVQTSSRLTWSFARDDALVFSKHIKRMGDRLGVPVWALLFNAFWLFVIGCIFLVSTSGELSQARSPHPQWVMLSVLAFTVFIGTAMVTELISFAFPAALLMWRGRASAYLPKNSLFNLGKAGWLVNSLVVGWTFVALVIFSMPVVQPVTAETMSKSWSLEMRVTKLTP